MNRNLLLFILFLLLLAMLPSISQPFLSESANANLESHLSRNQKSEASSEYDTDSLYIYVPSNGQIKVEPVDDAYTDSYYYLHNYGGSWRIDVDGWSFERRLGWLKFDLSEVPDNAYGVSATLKLGCSNAPNLEPEFVNQAPTVNAHYSSSIGWNEETITYSSQPSYNTTVLDSKRIYNGVWFAWNVSEAIIQSLSENRDLVTIVMENPKAYIWALSFNSKENGWNHPELIVEWSGIKYDFPTLVTGTFREDEDSKWRLYANTTITNNNEENITISWVSLNVHNVTYLDGTSQELSAKENRTANQLLLPREGFLTSWILTESGFNKEPKFLWVTLTVSFLEFQNQLTLTTAVPPDTTPPRISILHPENRTYATNEVPLTFTIDEFTDWIGYTLDGGTNVTTSGNATLNDLFEGPHNLVVYANDTFGNMGSSNIAYFHVDTLPPNIVVLSPKNKTYSASSISLNFTVSEPTSWIGFSLNGHVNDTLHATNTVLSELPDGLHSIIVYAKDMAGNTGASETINFSIDTQPPIQPFTLGIVAISILAIGGIALLAYLAKGKKTIEKGR